MSEQKKTPESAGPDEDFLTRWTRRKSEAAIAEPTPAEPAAPAVETAVEAETAPAEAGEPELTDADMPPIEDLDEDSDFSPFMSAGVSETLRKAALRKLFHSAKFNVCDGLDDYAEDYTKFAPLGNVITADMRFQMERALEKLAEGEDGESAGDAAGASVEDAGSQTETEMQSAGSDGGDGDDEGLEVEDDAARA